MKQSLGCSKVSLSFCQCKVTELHVILKDLMNINFSVLLERAIEHIWQQMWCSQGSVLQFSRCFCCEVAGFIFGGKVAWFFCLEFAWFGLERLRDFCVFVCGGCMIFLWRVCVICCAELACFSFEEVEWFFFGKVAWFLEKRLCEIVHGEIAWFLCVERLHYFSHSLTHSCCMIYFFGRLRDFFLQKGCVVFFVEILRDI